ncbi:MAG: hypothetical protein F6K28_05350 [Microcoleus sp. SIO2G3]|nr:hypothetical protein [Microcoleus sp. SIO2G3]
MVNSPESQNPTPPLAYAKTAPPPTGMPSGYTTQLSPYALCARASGGGDTARLTAVR